MGGDGLGDGAQGVTEVRFKEGAGVLGVCAIGHAGERHGGNLGSVSSPGKKVGDDGWGLVGSESDGARGWRLASGSGEAGCARPASAGWWAEASARRRGRVTRGRPALGERGEELGRTGICWAARDERKGSGLGRFGLGREF